MKVRYVPPLFFPGDSVYRQKYERVRREMDMTKKKQEQKHEEMEEQFAATKKQLDRKVRLPKDKKYPTDCVPYIYIYIYLS